MLPPTVTKATASTMANGTLASIPFPRPTASQMTIMSSTARGIFPRTLLDMIHTNDEQALNGRLLSWPQRELKATSPSLALKIFSSLTFSVHLVGMKRVTKLAHLPEGSYGSFAGYFKALYENICSCFENVWSSFTKHAPGAVSSNGLGLTRA